MHAVHRIVLILFRNDNLGRITDLFARQQTGNALNSVTLTSRQHLHANHAQGLLQCCADFTRQHHINVPAWTA